MPTIAIVGAGPGLGLSIAKVFGGHGFEVALVSRNKDKLGDLTKDLSAVGANAAGFAADTSDLAQLTRALEAAAARFGRIDVLEFSPHGGLDHPGGGHGREPRAADRRGRLFQGPLSPPRSLRCSPLQRSQLTSDDSPALVPTGSLGALMGTSWERKAV